jgi:phage gp29-like protein
VTAENQAAESEKYAEALSEVAQRMLADDIANIAEQLERAGTEPLTFELFPRRKKGQRGEEIVDPPISHTTTWDSQSITSALNALFSGSFQSSGYLVEAMLSDARVSTALNARIKGVTKCKPYLTPSKRAKDRKRAAYIADQLTELYEEILPEETTEQCWLWTIMQGWGLFNTPWDTRSEKVWIPRLRHWHPVNTYFLLAGKLEDRRFQAITMPGDEGQGGGNVAIVPGDPSWFLFAPFGEYRGWVRACLRQVAFPWLVRNYCLRDHSRAGEVHGLCPRVLKVPANATEADKTRIFWKLANLSSEATIVLPFSKDGDGFSLELLEAKSSEGISKIFEALGNRCDSDITLSIQGTQLMQSLGQSNAGGGHSLAASKSVREENNEYAESDAKKYAKAIKAQIFRPFAAFNYGDEDLAPDLLLSNEPPKDLSQKAKTWLDLSTAVLQFQDAGIELDFEEASQEFEVPIKSVGNPPSRDGDEGTDGEDDDQDEEDDPEIEIDDTDSDEDEETDDDGDETERGESRTPAAHAQSNRPKSRQRRPRATHALHGQRYVDRVRTRAAGHAIKAMAPHVGRVRAAVARAETPDQLRAELKRIARGIKRGTLEKLAENANLMAHMAGRNTIADESGKKPARRTTTAKPKKTKD